MPYPRFTKVIIRHFISKDKTISMRSMINLHTIRDDSFLGTLKFVSKTQDCQQYGALIPDDMINQDVKDSKAYKTYYEFTTGKATPKKARKFKKVASPSRKLSLVLEEEPAKKPNESVPKKKTPAKVDRGKGMDLLFDVALLDVPKNRINLHTICDDSLLDVKDSKAYKTYYDFAIGKATPKKARKFKKVASPSRKLSPFLGEEPTKKPKRAKKPAKKSTTVPTAGVAIKDAPSESMPKKKTPTKVDRGKGMDLLSDVALLEAA
ncbi:hypothetical protein Tco_0795364 [Tanacetum coccineum]